GSWLSAEEVVSYTKRTRKYHGYLFEVPASATGPVIPTPLTAMGRFQHEAAAVDPVTGIVYETEDGLAAQSSGFYRFRPTTPGSLAAGGTLWMLGVAGQPGYDTHLGQTVGVALPATWVPIPTPNSISSDPQA